MIHKTKILKITDNFETTVEITGNLNSGKVIFFSHGFGVQRDARGMFIDIENQLKHDFLCVRFDYNQIESNGNMKVQSFEFMKNTLEKVIDYISNNYNFNKKHLIAHSMGNVITGLLQQKNFKSIILLAPPILPPFDGLVTYFKKRKGTNINLNEESTIKRSDGTITTVGKQFFEDMRTTNPLNLYKKLSKLTKLSVIRPKNDPVIQDSYQKIYKLSNINIVEINGNHDFSENSRENLLKNIKLLINF